MLKYYQTVIYLPKGNRRARNDTENTTCTKQQNPLRDTTNHRTLGKRPPRKRTNQLRKRIRQILQTLPRPSPPKQTTHDDTTLRRGRPNPRLLRLHERPKPKPKKKLYEKILSVFSNGISNSEDFEDIDSESEIEIDESEEYPEEWGI